MIRRVVAALRSPATRDNANAAVERLIARGTSAVVGLVVAVFVSPSEAGVYATAFIALSLVQEVGENTMRQLGVGLWRMEGGGRIIRRASLGISLGGAVAMAAVLGVFFATSIASASQTVALLPFVPLAAVYGLSIPWITLAQYDGRWAAISRGQAVGSIASIVLCVPLAPTIGIAAGSLQTCITEGVLLLLLIKGAVRPEPDLPRRPLLRDFIAPTVQSNFLGWLQGQSERIVVVAFGGATTLGLYSIASQIARAVSDSVVLGLTNVLRSRLAAADTDSARRTVLRSIVSQGVVIALVLQITMVALDLFVLGRILSSQWTPALLAVPVMSVSAAPLACMWLLSSFLIVEGRARVLVPWHWLGVGLGVATGFTVAVDLLTGVVVGAARDVVALAVRLPYVAGDLGRRFVLRMILACSTGIVIGAIGFGSACSIHR